MERKLHHVIIGEQEYDFPRGMTFREIVDEVLSGASDHAGELSAAVADTQASRANEEDLSPVLLVNQDGKLREFRHKLDKDCRLEFVRFTDETGYRAYQRTAMLILLKAMFDVCGKKDTEKAVVHYNLGDGLYFRQNYHYE